MDSLKQTLKNSLELRFKHLKVTDHFLDRFFDRHIDYRTLKLLTRYLSDHFCETIFDCLTNKSSRNGKKEGYRIVLDSVYFVFRFHSQFNKLYLVTVYVRE